MLKQRFEYHLDRTKNYEPNDVNFWTSGICDLELNRTENLLARCRSRSSEILEVMRARQVLIQRSPVDNWRRMTLR